jgi:hypothetical protein
MSRTVTLLGLAQAVTVICGFFGLAIVLRYRGYPGEPSQAGSNFVIYHWSHLVLFLRGVGLILLVVPLVWTVLATVSERRAKCAVPFGLWLIVGTIMPFAIVATFLYAILHPCIAVPN